MNENMDFIPEEAESFEAKTPDYLDQANPEMGEATTEASPVRAGNVFLKKFNEMHRGDKEALIYGSPVVAAAIAAAYFGASKLAPGIVEGVASNPGEAFAIAGAGLSILLGLEIGARANGDSMFRRL